VMDPRAGYLLVLSGEARKVSRRRMLRWVTQTAAVVGGLTIGRPGHVAAASGVPAVARTAVTAVRPARQVHECYSLRHRTLSR
jgi:hypothetical protein